MTAQSPTPAQALLRLDIVSVFPEYLAPLQLSLVGKAITAGIVDLRVHDLRSWTTDRHRTVDDAPYGGGAGMLMQPEPWGRALDELLEDQSAAAGTVLLVPTPAGRLFTQPDAERLSRAGRLIIACGRYEGLDTRVVEHYATRLPVEEVSIGDYVLAGGEAAALVMAEAVVRLMPGVLGNPASVQEESHAAAGDRLLEHPSYTRPECWRSLPVPPVLTSGDHAQVARWRRDAALRRTAAQRPDLLRRLDRERLSADDESTLADLGWVGSEDGRFHPPPGSVAH